MSTSPPPCPSSYSSMPLHLLLALLLLVGLFPTCRSQTTAYYSCDPYEDGTFDPEGAYSFNVLKLLVDMNDSTPYYNYTNTWDEYGNYSDTAYGRAFCNNFSNCEDCIYVAFYHVYVECYNRSISAGTVHLVDSCEVQYADCQTCFNEINVPSSSPPPPSPPPYRTSPPSTRPPPTSYYDYSPPPPPLQPRVVGSPPPPPQQPRVVGSGGEGGRVDDGVTGKGEVNKLYFIIPSVVAGVVIVVSVALFFVIWARIRDPRDGNGTHEDFRMPPMQREGTADAGGYSHPRPMSSGDQGFGPPQQPWPPSRGAGDSIPPQQSWPSSGSA